jgi:hypothetical protein
VIAVRTAQTSLICYVTDYFVVISCLINVLGTGKLKENTWLVDSVTNGDYRRCVNRRGERVVNMGLIL